MQTVLKTENLYKMYGSQVALDTVKYPRDELSDCSAPTEAERRR